MSSNDENQQSVLYATQKADELTRIATEESQKIREKRRKPVSCTEE